MLIELVAQTAIAHGDPGAAHGSNATPFRMLEILHDRPSPAMRVEADPPIGEEPSNLRLQNIHHAESALVDLAAQYPIPEGSALALALQQLSAEEFTATAFVYELITQLNSLNGGEGAGLFSGMERYDRLLSRLAIVSSQFNTSFFTLYSSLLRELRIDTHLARFTDVLLCFASLPRTIQQAVIVTMGKNRQAILTIARAWFNAARELRDTERRQPSGTIYYDPVGRVQGTSLTQAEVAIPHVSSNSFRHSIFRETLTNHLLSVTELGPMREVNKQRLLPAFVAQMLSNGGNMQAKAVAPDTSEAMSLAAKEAFPMWDLLGVTFPTHMMEGALALPNWTLCLQNNQFTAPKGFTSDVDAASLLTILTHARGTPDGMDHSKEAGQMLFAHTVMKQGARLLLEIRFKPFTSELARGAAFFALYSWLEAGGQVGGHESQGEGMFAAERIVGDEDAAKELARHYQAYVESRPELLREHLVNGSLGWYKRPVAWG